jgi:hypothetical protein
MGAAISSKKDTQEQFFRMVNNITNEVTMKANAQCFVSAQQVQHVKICAKTIHDIDVTQKQQVVMKSSCSQSQQLTAKNVADAQNKLKSDMKIKDESGSEGWGFVKVSETTQRLISDNVNNILNKTNLQIASTAVINHLNKQVAEVGNCNTTESVYNVNVTQDMDSDIQVQIVQKAIMSSNQAATAINDAMAAQSSARENAINKMIIQIAIVVGAIIVVVVVLGLIYKFSGKGGGGGGGVTVVTAPAPATRGLRYARRK